MTNPCNILKMSEPKKVKSKMKGCQENLHHIYSDNFATSLVSFRELNSNDPKYKIACFNEDDNFYKPYEINLISKMLCKYDCKKCNRSFMLNSIELVEGKWCICCAYVKGQELKGVCGCIEEHKGECKEESKLLKKKNINIKTEIKTEIKDEHIENYTTKTEKELKEEKFHRYPKTFEDSFASFEDKKDPKGSKYKVSCYSSNNKYKSTEITKGSSLYCDFDCSCGHTFNKRIDTITGKSKSWCPYCIGSKLCGIPTCQMCKDNSIVVHKMFKFWHESNTLNPYLIFKHEKKTSAFFSCLDDICPHISEIPIAHVMYGTKTRCSYCLDCILCKEEENCSICLNKSFAYKFPEQTKSWDNNENEIKATEVFNGCDKHFNFKCIICKHKFKKQPSTIKARDVWCEYCSGRTLCGDIDCIDCFNKSFAKIPKAKYWHKDNNFQPHQVHLQSSRKAKFECEKGHEFTTVLSYISRENEGTWCPLCVHKTEAMVYEFLIEIFGNDVLSEFKFIWCKSLTNNKYCLRFDILIKSKNILIEVDDVYRNRINWKEKILKAIKNIVKVNEPCVVYIAHKDHVNIYHKHRHEMEIYYTPLPNDYEFPDED